MEPAPPPLTDPGLLHAEDLQPNTECGIKRHSSFVCAVSYYSQGGRAEPAHILGTVFGLLSVFRFNASCFHVRLLNVYGP